MFNFNQFLHFFSNQSFKNLILIRFNGIEANHLYVYKKKIILKIIHIKFFNISKSYETLWYKKASDNPKKKLYTDMIKSVTQRVDG
jgi:hypothetical protein